MLTSEIFLGSLVSVHLEEVNVKLFAFVTILVSDNEPLLSDGTVIYLQRVSSF